MTQNFDLHIHTNYSDGCHSVREIIEMAKALKLNTFSITDHDDINSVADVKKNDLGGINYLPGVEISSLYNYNNNKYKMHILGYLIDTTDEELLNLLKELKEARSIRFIEMYDYLKSQYDIELPVNVVKKIAKTESTPGKPHMAELLIKYGFVKTTNEAFTKYLDFVKTKTSNRADAVRVIKTIKKAGGIAIWAHPKKVEKEYNIDFTYLLDSLIYEGIDGIEVYNSLHSYSDCLRYESIAVNKNIMISGGSDFHGKAVKKNVDMANIFNSDENIKIEEGKISILRKREIK